MLLLVFAPLVFSFAFTSFMHAKELLLGLGVLLMSGLRAWQSLRCGLRVSRSGSVLLPLWLWVLLSLAAVCFGLTGAVPAYAVEEGIRLTLVMLFVHLNSDLIAQVHWRWRIYHAFIVSGVLAAGLGVFQYVGLLNWLLPPFAGYTQRIYSVFGNQDLLGGYLAVALALSVWACGQVGRWRRILLLCAVGVMAVSLVLTGARSAWLAAVVGAGWSLFHLSARQARVPLLAALACATALAALLTWAETGARITGTLQAGDIGGRARIWFWDAALRMAADHPLLGVGLGQYQLWSPHYQGAALAGRFGATHFQNELHTFHAHSVPLDVIAETGLLGVGLLVWLAVRGRWRRRNAWGALLALGIFSLFNSSLHSTPHLLAGLVLLAMAGQTRPVSVGNRWCLVIAPLACLIVVAGHWWVTLIPSARLCAAEDAHLRGESAGQLYQHALEHPWPACHAQEAYALWLMDAGWYPEAYRALAVARAGLDTGRVHYLSALAAAELGLAEEARLHWEACQWRWPGRGR